MSDIGQWNGQPGEPSWARAGLDAIERAPVDTGRARVRDERVMIVFRSGPMLPATVVTPWEPGEPRLALVVTDVPAGAYAWMPAGMLRTIIAEGCLCCER